MKNSITYLKWSVRHTSVWSRSSCMFQQKLTIAMLPYVV